jgi:hypothetical protein
LLHGSKKKSFATGHLLPSQSPVYKTLMLVSKFQVRLQVCPCLKDFLTENKPCSSQPITIESVTIEAVMIKFAKFGSLKVFSLFPALPKNIGFIAIVSSGLGLVPRDLNFPSILKVTYTLLQLAVIPLDKATIASRVSEKVALCLKAKNFRKNRTF